VGGGGGGVGIVPNSRINPLLSVCGGCSFGGFGCCPCRVCVGGVLCRVFVYVTCYFFLQVRTD